MSPLKIQKITLDNDPTLNHLKEAVIIEKISNSSTDTQGLNISLVKFPLGVKRPWSSHTQDQYVLIMSGKGVIASRDEEIELNPRDFVFIPANIEHEHGASKENEMVQLSIIGGIKPRESIISIQSEVLE